MLRLGRRKPEGNLIALTEGVFFRPDDDRLKKKWRGENPVGLSAVKSVCRRSNLLFVPGIVGKMSVMTGLDWVIDAGAGRGAERRGLYLL